MVLLWNSTWDERKGGKLQQRWLGPYVIGEFVGKGVYKITNPKTGQTLKKGVNVRMQAKDIPRISVCL